MASDTGPRRPSKPTLPRQGFGQSRRKWQNSADSNSGAVPAAAVAAVVVAEAAATEAAAPFGADLPAAGPDRGWLFRVAPLDRRLAGA